MAAQGHLRPFAASSATGCRAPKPAVRFDEMNRADGGHSPRTVIALVGNLWWPVSITV